MTNCPYCGGEIPSKDFALRTPGDSHFHFPCSDKALDEWVKLREENAKLREENDLQRHSIQQLSAQVADLQKLNKQLLEYIAPIDGCDCEGCIEAKDVIEKYGLPNPGADLLAKMEKLEAVADVARFLLNLNQNGCMSQVGEAQLIKALAALEGTADE